jgi:hypothetical protein
MLNIRTFAALVAAVFISFGNPAAEAGDSPVGYLVAAFDFPTHGAFALSTDRKTAYYVWDKAGDAKAHLSVIDLADPYHPRRAPDVPIDPILGNADVLIQADRLYFLSGAGKRDLLIFDLTTPATPKLASEIRDAKLDSLALSSDGRIISEADDTDETDVAYDVSDPRHPVPTDPPNVDTGDDLTQPRAPRLYPEHLIDQSGKLLLSGEDKTLHVRYLTRYGPLLDSPWGSVELNEEPISAHLLTGDSLVLVEGESRITIYSGVPLQVPAGTIIKAHAEAVDKYRKFVSNDPKNGIDPEEAVSILANAGIETLLDAPPRGLSPAERTAILDDYGFWLDRMQVPERAVPILRKVTELAPNRGVAWLNLADALRDLMIASESEAEKSALWQSAHAAYARYAQLTGKHSAAGDALASFDVPHTQVATPDVCTFVADAFNHGQSAAISAPSGTVSINGNLLHFHAGWNGGSCAEAAMKLDGDDDDDTPPGLEVGGTHGPFGTSPDSILVVPFHGKSYLVAVEDGGPYEVVEPFRGPVCGFKRSFRPTLTVNRDSGLCQRFLGGKLADDIPWHSIDPRKITSSWDVFMGTNFIHVDRIAQTMLSGSQCPLRIGHYYMASNGGCGCSYGGVALLDGDTLDKSPKDETLVEAQYGDRCRDADAGLARIGGQTYVQAFGGTALYRNEPPRTLLRLDHDTFQPVCRVDQVVTYQPVAGIPSAVSIAPASIFDPRTWNAVPAKTKDPQIP